MLPKRTPINGSPLPGSPTIIKTPATQTPNERSVKGWRRSLSIKKAKIEDKKG
jgi:hypothetical protein